MSIFNIFSNRAIKEHLDYSNAKLRHMRGLQRLNSLLMAWDDGLAPEHLVIKRYKDLNIKTHEFFSVDYTIIDGEIERRDIFKEIAEMFQNN